MCVYVDVCNVSCVCFREQMESMVEQLQVKLQDSQQGVRAGAAELQQLQAEHDTLLERHNQILQESVAKEAELRERCVGALSARATGSSLDRTKPPLTPQPLLTRPSRSLPASCAPLPSILHPSQTPGPPDGERVPA